MVLKPEAWEQIGVSPHILDWITNGVPIILQCNPGDFELPNFALNECTRKFVTEEIERLSHLDAIERCEHKPRCASPINVVPKKNNKERLIIDLRFLKSHIDAPRFTNEDIWTVKNLIQEGDQLITVDIKDFF